MKKKHVLIYLFVLVGFLASCSSDKEDILLPEISGIAEKYVLDLDESVLITPEVKLAEMPKYEWILDNKVVSETLEFQFKSDKSGKFEFTFRVTEKGRQVQAKTVIMVREKLQELFQAKGGIHTILSLEAPKAFSGNSELHWEVVEASSPLHRLVDAGKNAQFIASEAGMFMLQIYDEEKVANLEVHVTPATREISPYFAKAFDFLPAPGQFVNKLPKYNEGDTHEDMLAKVEKQMVGKKTSMITLGGWGGYVTLGFDHTITNVKGKRDFLIKGNAFGSAGGRPGAPFGGSCEPGIIMVAYDKNKNGVPDEDEWYEIKGSSNFSGKGEPWYQYAVDNKNDTFVYRDFEMTYHRPKKEKLDEGESVEPGSFTYMKDYIAWENNKDKKGFKEKNTFHNQSYYPQWITEDKITFKGIRLLENGINEGEYMPGINENNFYFVLYGFRYGYVDNHPNNSPLAGIDIDWAIDKNGNKANLPGIDFVKVYNGVDQENGWLGECSTEVDGGYDLHLLGLSYDTVPEDEL